MITVTAMDKGINYTVKPTTFPDGTTQVWQLPNEIIKSLNTKIVWHYENDAEIMQLGSLRALLNQSKFVHLHMPFLPYGRQDKDVSNDSTFNLTVLSAMLNTFQFSLVSTVDAHNPRVATALIRNFHNIEIKSTVQAIVDLKNITRVAYPDDGARARYGIHAHNINRDTTITGYKMRDQTTGYITHYQLDSTDIDTKDKILIVDDICDGGATFIHLVKAIKTINPYVEVNLFVTHGIFSKGRQILLDAGIKNIYTTDTIPKNTDGIKV